MDPERQPERSESRALEPSSTGLDANLAGALCYLLGFLTGLAFLVLEKRSTFVRFHAWQSTVTFLVLFVVNVVGGVIPLLGWAISALASLAAVVLWIVFMVKAFQGERWQLPVVGEIAQERAKLG